MSRADLERDRADDDGLVLFGRGGLIDREHLHVAQDGFRGRVCGRRRGEPQHIDSIARQEKASHADHVVYPTVTARIFSDNDAASVLPSSSSANRSRIKISPATIGCTVT